MLNMQAFYKLLSSAARPQDRYTDALARLTKTGPAQMQALASDLSWQDWWEDPKVETLKI